MLPSYPLLIPEPSDIQGFDMAMQSLTAVAVSPFSGMQQVQLHPGQYWRASVQIVPSPRAPAEVWLSFLASLFGRYGTFYMGDPKGGVPNGFAASSAGLPKILNSSQSGAVLNIYGAPSSVAGYLLPGDYLTVGSTSLTRLHKVVNTVSTLSGGVCSAQVWPFLKPQAINSGDAIMVRSCVGIWRLQSNEPGWSEDNVFHHIDFECVEAL